MACETLTRPLRCRCARHQTEATAVVGVDAAMTWARTPRALPLPTSPNPRRCRAGWKNGFAGVLDRQHVPAGDRRAGRSLQPSISRSTVTSWPGNDRTRPRRRGAAGQFAGPGIGARRPHRELSPLLSRRRRAAYAKWFGVVAAMAWFRCGLDQHGAPSDSEALDRNHIEPGSPEETQVRGRFLNFSPPNAKSRSANRR